MTDEVFYRSPGVFQEYFNNPEATAQTTKMRKMVGWRPGDAGILQHDDGHLMIIDRAKDVGNHEGWYPIFAPKYLENKLKFFPFIKEVVTFGHKTLILYQPSSALTLKLWETGRSVKTWPYSGYTDLASRDQKSMTWFMNAWKAVNSLILARDDKLRGSQIKRFLRFLILHKELDADDGELTRTRKVRRRISLLNDINHLIDALQDESQANSLWH